MVKWRGRVLFEILKCAQEVKAFLRSICKWKNVFPFELSNCLLCVMLLGDGSIFFSNSWGTFLKGWNKILCIKEEFKNFLNFELNFVSKWWMGNGKCNRNSHTRVINLLRKCILLSNEILRYTLILDIVFCEPASGT